MNIEEFEKYHLCDFEYLEEMNCIEEEEIKILETIRKLKESE